MKNLLTFCLVMTMFWACTPTIHYLGDDYAPREVIDIYYDENDVDRPFKVIGHLTHDTHLNYSLETLRNEMELTARMKGADAIIYTELSHDLEVDSSNKLMINAKLIRYRE